MFTVNGLAVHHWGDFKTYRSIYSRHDAEMSEGSWASTNSHSHTKTRQTPTNPALLGRIFNLNTLTPPHLQFKVGFVFSNHWSWRSFNHIVLYMVQAHTEVHGCSERSRRNWPEMYFWGFCQGGTKSCLHLWGVWPRAAAC